VIYAGHATRLRAAGFPAGLFFYAGLSSLSGLGKLSLVIPDAAQRRSGIQAKKTNLPKFSGALADVSFNPNLNVYLSGQRR